MQNVKEMMHVVGIDTVIQNDGVAPIIAGCACTTVFNEAVCDSHKEECTA